MKKPMKLALAAAVGALAVLGTLYGPAALDLYRASDRLQAVADEDDATLGRWPQVQAECAVCHGHRGNPVNAAYARLAGQPAEYLVRQLSAMANGDRPSPIMGPLAQTLTPADIGRLARYYGAQAPEAHAGGDAATLARGAALARSCTACHGATLAGTGLFPRLAGQGDIYLQEQLDAFRSGARRDNGDVMANVARQIRADDIPALSRYLASLGAAR